MLAHHLLEGRNNRIMREHQNCSLPSPMFTGMSAAAHNSAALAGKFRVDGCQLMSRVTYASLRIERLLAHSSVPVD
jgi:hypothetical protein